MVFKPKSYKLLCPRLCIDNQLLKYTDDIIYLGFTFSSDQMDDKDLLRQLRMLYTKSNRLLRLFYHCSTDVKIALFRSYCTFFTVLSLHCIALLGNVGPSTALTLHYNYIVSASTLEVVT